MGETESIGGLEFANSEEEITEWGGHPLFPRAETETGPDRRKFDLIHIQRIRSDGTRDICPKAWRGADLRSWEQIVEAYGGGTYQLVAQCSRTFRYQAWGEKVFLSGPSKPFVGTVQSETRAPMHEMAPEVVPQHAHMMSAPMPSAPNAPHYAQSAPYGYPYPPPAPPPAAPLASSGNGETIALVRAVIEGNNAERTALMRALLERPAVKETGSLEVVREILPMMQGMQGGNGTQALLQGVELAKGLIGPVNHAAPPPPAQGNAEDDLALLGQVLRMIAPAAAAPAAPVAAPVAAPSVPPAAMIPPPGAPPPGCTWAYTMTGWALVQLAQVQPYAAVPMQAPVAVPQAQPMAQPAAKPIEAVKPAGSSGANSNPLGGIEEALGDPEFSKLIASLSMLGGTA